MGMSSPSFIITSLGDDPLIDDKRRVECQPPSVGYIKLMVKQWWAIIDVMNLMTQSGSCIDMTMIWVIYEIVYAQSVRKDWRTKYDTRQRVYYYYATIKWRCVLG